MPDYKDFIKKVNRKHSIDLSLYKEKQMKRRITTLRNKHGFHTFNAYYTQMDKEKELMEEFIDRLTINVSEFYRNPKRWDVLKDKVLPQLIGKKRHLSIWSAACSTGDEPYSLSIMLKEHFPEIDVKILATDIDETALSKAKAGLYQEQALKELSLNHKLKYFTKSGDTYKIDDSLKRTITFKKHNLLRDRYPMNVDLIICRNVLIYFTDEAKELIYRNFSKSINEEGVLFVGSTEQVFSPEQYNFSLLDTFFYQKMKTSK